MTATGDSYLGILTTNAIARWLAAQLAATAGLAQAETVGHVLKFAEQHERSRHVPRSITAADAIHRLSTASQEGKPLTALIITQSGRSTEKPLRVVVDDDLPALVSALAIRLRPAAGYPVGITRSGGPAMACPFARPSTGLSLDVIKGLD